MNGFEGFDEVDPPEQWDDIVRRAELGAIDRQPLVPGPRPRRTVLVTAAAATLVVVTVGALVLSRREAETSVETIDSTLPMPSSSNSTLSNSTSSTTSTAPASRPLPCSSTADLDQINSLFFSGGTPAIDYDVATDLADLVGKSDVVVAGFVTSIGQLDRTVFELTEVEVLAGDGEVEEFGSWGSRPDGPNTYPVGRQRTLEGLRIVAFLNANDGWPGGWEARLDGLGLACAEDTEVALLNLPADARGLSLDELIDRVAAIGEPLERPVVGGDRCPPLTAGGGPFEASDEFRLFAISSDQPVAIQIVGQPGTTPASPFALIERFAPGSSSSAESRAGSNESIRMYPNGNGEVFLRFDDGSIGYVRARGLSEEEVQAIVDSLIPLPADSGFPGFVVDDVTGRFESLHEQMSNDVSGRSAGSDCRVVGTDAALEGDTLNYTVEVFAGDPIFQFARVIDRSPPLDVAMRGNAVIIVTGIDHPAAVRVPEIVNADAGEWARLLAATPQPEG